MLGKERGLGKAVAKEKLLRSDHRTDGAIPPGAFARSAVGGAPVQAW